MASSVVAELEAGLQAMAALKPPGVSGSRITNITALCVANVQYESVIIQKLFTHFKKTPGTHKLGVLYVVDSVTRKWLDQAKAQGQTPSLAAPDGTFAAGVHRVTELIPILMNDIIATAPEDQKEKIKKLVDIWEKGQTFPPSMVNSFKEKLNAPRPNESTTPPGSPPPNLLASLGVGSKPPPPPPPPASSSSSVVPNLILDKLASIARQNASSAQSNPNLSAPAPASAPAPVPASTTPAAPPASGPVYGAAAGGPAVPGSGAAQPAPAPYGAQPALPPYMPTSQPPAQPVNVPGLPYAYPPAPVPAAAVPPAPVASGAIPPPPAAAGAAAAPASNPTAATVQLVAALAAQGIPLDKIAGVIQMMTQSGAIPAAAPAAAAAAPQMPQPTQTGYTTASPQPPAAAGPAPWEAPRPDHDRDRSGSGYHDGMRSPNRARGRSRSRSPGRWDGRLSPRSRGGYEYGRPPSPGRGRPDDRGRGRGGGPMSEYRQRSPHRYSGAEEPRDPPKLEKFIEYDNTLPPGHIKVYSRTLFVGGVTCTEPELRDIFNRFGQVQTCIVNREKRHAFVKMYSRKDAEHAKAMMEERNHEYQLRTRWGVGFGPRDCSDYATGISVIPIHKLTEADRKWMLTAPYGGSGGRPIVHGLCVEEPDIEIGAGVSSKAISRRMQTDKSGQHGPKSTKREEENGGGGGPGGKWRHKDKHRRSGGGPGGAEGGKAGNNNNDDSIVVDALPAGITMGPNGINYPPNFAFGAPAAASNP
ncbi:hypothetical protein VTJ04DRAFT_9210 [Mycothermus thermophilus]|uniref:uncharacterized protein n=1 Tax=Humicola insolens TaxID=85995 RepID=UPI0037440188